MININLLPPEFGPKKAITLINIVIIFLSTFICLSLILASLKLLNTAQDYSTRLDYHENQVKYFERQVEDVHELANKVKLLKARLRLVQELLHEQSVWSDKLVELAECLPNYGAWIDTLTIERPKSRTPASSAAPESAPSPVVAHIKGYCISVDKVSQFVGSLENSDIFGSIVFDSATTDAAGDETFVNFKFSVALPTL